MLPVLEGTIRRRILLNFRASPAVVAKLLPTPLEVLTHNGFAIVGVCLIELSHLRPKGFPAALGISSTSMAQRVAVLYPTSQGIREGVFVWRRETNQPILKLLGGRIFPGVQDHAKFEIDDQIDRISVKVTTKNREADLEFQATPAPDWQPTPAFAQQSEASEFLHRGDCGYSCARSEGEFEGLQLKTLEWAVAPLTVTNLHASFFQNSRDFPEGGIQFDSAFVMSNILHEWHSISERDQLTCTLPSQTAARMA